jgi:histidinol-phosphate aminotransferase
VGLLDYYRQFEAMTEEEVNAGLRERAARDRALALERVEPLDLSGTTSPELPHSEIVNAITYAARGWGLNRYPDRFATELRRRLAEEHGVEPRQIVVGDGAGQLLAAAAAALLGPGEELLTPWPSYALYPLMAQRSGGQAVPVPGFAPDALLEAVTDRTRVITICNPNDPTGEYLGVEALGTLLGRLPDHVTVLLDEALGDYVDAEPPDAALALLDAFPRLVVVRTFSKAWGLSGLRCGYALGAPGSEALLDSLAPPLGVSALAQAGAVEAMRRCPQIVARRREVVAAERRRIEERLAHLPIDATPSQANFLWLAAPSLTGDELAARLERQGVIVQPGGPLGAEDHVRAAVQGPPATDRLLRALEIALGAAG